MFSVHASSSRVSQEAAHNLTDGSVVVEYPLRRHEPFPQDVTAPRPHETNAVAELRACWERPSEQRTRSENWHVLEQVS